MVFRPSVLCAHMRCVCLTTNSSRADDDAYGVQQKPPLTTLWYTVQRCRRGTSERVVLRLTSGFCLIFFVRPVFIDFHHNTPTTNNKQ